MGVCISQNVSYNTVITSKNEHISRHMLIFPSRVDVNDLLVDKQNGFRRGRSCVDHISSLTSNIETRKLMKKCTYAAFIDFSKAYDRINRNMLFSKLSALGLKGIFFKSMKAIYSLVRCTVKGNGVLSDFFNVSSGPKQGCLLYYHRCCLTST